MDREAFMKLVDDNDGFEFVIGYRDDLDFYIGGKGNTYWFLWTKGNKSEYYVGTYENGSWTDKFYIKKGSKLESKTVDNETTIKMIVERAYFYQDKMVGKKDFKIVIGCREVEII